MGRSAAAHAARPARRRRARAGGRGHAGADPQSAWATRVCSASVRARRSASWSRSPPPGWPRCTANSGSRFAGALVASVVGVPARQRRAGRRDAGEAGARRGRGHRAADVADQRHLAGRPGGAEPLPVLGRRVRSPGQDAGVVLRVLPFVLAGVVLALASAPALNSMALGDDVATALGRRVGLVRLQGAVAITLLTGSAVAVVGPIVFVGLVVPHVARAITGPDHRWLLPFSMVLAPVLVLAADIVGPADRAAGGDRGRHRRRVRRRAVLHRAGAPAPAGGAVDGRHRRPLPARRAAGVRGAAAAAARGVRSCWGSSRSSCSAWA